MTTSSPTRPRYTSVRIPEGKTVRVMAQTASRDYTAQIVPGEYPIEYTDVNYRPTPDAERPYYALIRVQIESPERRESTVEFGGVALASRTVPASTDSHTICLYGYMLETNATGTPDFRFGYEFIEAEPEPWEGHPDIPVSPEELQRLIAEDERNWR